MEHFHEEQKEPHQREVKRRKARKEAEKRLGARRIVEVVEWVQYPLVYWAGSAPGMDFAPDALYRPVIHIIAQSLAACPEGLYAVRLAWRDLNPSVEQTIAVTQKMLTCTSRALVASRKYPRALPRIVADVETWRSRAEHGLRVARAALEAVARLKSNAPEALALEELALWIGPQEPRPSRTLDTESIVQWLSSVRDPEIHGSCLGAIVLGQRRFGRMLPGKLQMWQEVGRAFVHWPPDWLFQLLREEDNLSGILVLRAQNSKLDSREVALAALECGLQAKGNVADVLTSIGQFQQVLDRMYGEFELRWQMFRHFVEGTLASVKEHCQGMLARAWTVESRVMLERVFSEAMTQYSTSLGLPDEPQTVERFFRWFKKEHLSSAVAWFLGYKRLPDRELLQPSISAEELDSIVFGVVVPVSPREFVEGLSKWVAYEEAARLPIPAHWRTTAGGLAGRACRCHPPSETFTLLASWFDHCRRVCPPGETGEVALRLAIRGMERGMASASQVPENVTRLLEILGNEGGFLLHWAVRQDEYFPLVFQSPLLIYEEARFFGDNIPFGLLGRLGALSLEQCRLILERDLFGQVAIVLERNPAALVPFLQWVVRCGEGWSRLDHDQKQSFAEACCAEPAGLGVTLLEWSQSLVLEHGFALEEAAGFLDAVMDLLRWAELPLGEFLRGHFWVLHEIGMAVGQFRQKLSAKQEVSFADVCEAFEHRLPVIEFALSWSRNNYPDLWGAVEVLLRHCACVDDQAIARHAERLPRYFPRMSREEYEFAVTISDGVPARLATLGRCLEERKPYRHAMSPLEGWRFLKREPQVGRFLVQCTSGREVLLRVIRLLSRVALVLRFQERDAFSDALARWVGMAPIVLRGIPPWLPPGLASQLGLLAAYRAMAGRGESLPLVVKRIIDRPQALHRERLFLEERERSGMLPASAVARLANLRRYLSDPVRVQNWVTRDLTAEIDSQLVVAKLEALEEIVSQAIQAHWCTILGETGRRYDDPDWDNALLLLLRLNQIWVKEKLNRRLLRKLLWHQARGDREWTRRLPPNQKFIREMTARGINMDVWMGAFERQYQVGDETWTVYAETDPLRVLQMGNLFGTCLSVKGDFSYAAIANAVEANKRVLYLKNAQGSIIGRKLIALSPGGELIGCYSYGSGIGGESARPMHWVKILFDVFCLEFARSSHAVLAGEDIEDSRLLEDELRMFAHWYFDGVEPFDWWVKEMEAYGAKSNLKELRPIARKLLRRLRDSDEESQPSTLRALLWFGESALPIIRVALAKGWLHRTELHFIRVNSCSVQVRRETTQWLSRAEGNGARDKTAGHGFGHEGKSTHSLVIP